MLLPTDADDNEPASRAIALADYGLHSAVKMAQACTREGLEHIIGLRVRVAPERRVRAWGEKPSELVLLVVDEEGWANVVALCNLGWLSGYDRGPRIDLRDLSCHSEGLVCLTGAPGVGLLPRALEQVPDPTLPAEALPLARQLAAMFPERLYLELAYHGQPQRCVRRAMNYLYLQSSAADRKTWTPSRSRRYGSSDATYPAATQGHSDRGLD